MSNHKTITDDEEFGTTLISAGSKLVVVDFNATWCGPCQEIAPIFGQLAHKFPDALFLGVDIDLCRETAVEQGVNTLPTFIIYKYLVPVDQIRGAHPEELEEKISLHYEQVESTNPQFSSPGGISDLAQYIEQNGCECLNEADETPFQAFLEGKSILISDCDEQLIISYGFNQNIKLQSIKIKSTADNGPKVVKLFINQPKTLDFESALNMTPVQEIILTESDLTGNEPVQLRFVKFQLVSNLQIFVTENQNSSEVTQIDSLTLYGSPVNTTKMGEFKRVSGNKGESH